MREPQTTMNQCCSVFRRAMHLNKEKKIKKKLECYTQIKRLNELKRVEKSVFTTTRK